VLEAARTAGAGAAIYSPLAGGFLTDDFADASPRHPLARPARGDATAIGATRTKVRALKAALEGTGLTLAQAAIRFCLMHEGVTTVLGGFSSVEQMEEIVGRRVARHRVGRGPVRGQCVNAGIDYKGNVFAN
jgi:aryl-alcohol dehydrogenase-like predicted oxidoreductase